MVANADVQSVQSVERALSLLDMLVDRGGSATITELTSASGLPMPTVHRLLQSMQHAGYVHKRPDRSYSLGAKNLLMAEVASHTLRSAVMPYLHELVDLTKETANAALLDGQSVVYIAQVPSAYSMRTFTEVGRRVDVHSTGVGKALMATLPAERVASILTVAGMPRRTPDTITDIDDFMDEVKRIQRRGWATDNGEQEIGSQCIAVAVPSSSFRAALSVSGPQVRMQAMDSSQIARQLMDAARRLVAELDA